MSEVKHSSLNIKNKKVLTLDGVSNIKEFDPTYLSLETDMGEIVAEGEDMRIESLQAENGEIVIVGEISGVFYGRPAKRKRRGGLFG